MSVARLADRPHRLVLLAMIGIALALRPWVANEGAPGAAPDGSYHFVVTSSEDAGAGSLRETLFRANRAPGRARVEIVVDQIRLHVPLPPLANPDGVHLVARSDSVVITGPSVGTIPLLDVVAHRSVIEGIVVESPGSVCVRATARVLVQDVVLRQCEIGLLLGGRAGGTEVTATRFEGNVSGLRIDGVPGGVRVVGNAFTRHSEVAIWVGGSDDAGGPGVPNISENSFDGDRIAILLAGPRSEVSNNRIRGGLEAGILLGGTGHRVVDNRIELGERVGILVEGARGSLIEANEIEANRGVGILVRSGSGVVVRDNEVHRNGYGLMFLLGDRRSPTVAEGNVASGNRVDGIAVVGASPVLRDNVASGNRKAGIRIDDWVGSGGTVAANPLVDANRLSNNGENGPVRGRYPVS